MRQCCVTGCESVASILLFTHCQTIGYTSVGSKFKNARLCSIGKQSPFCLYCSVPHRMNLLGLAFPFLTPFLYLKVCLMSTLAKASEGMLVYKRNCGWFQTDLYRWESVSKWEWSFLGIDITSLSNRPIPIFSPSSTLCFPNFLLFWFFFRMYSQEVVAAIWKENFAFWRGQIKLWLRVVPRFLPLILIISAIFPSCPQGHH